MQSLCAKLRKFPAGEMYQIIQRNKPNNTFPLPPSPSNSQNSSFCFMPICAELGTRDNCLWLTLSPVTLTQKFVFKIHLDFLVQIFFYNLGCESSLVVVWSYTAVLRIVASLVLPYWTADCCVDADDFAAFESVYCSSCIWIRVIYMKGVCHEIFYLYFSWFEPIWTLTNRFKYCPIWFQFDHDIQS